MNMKLKYVFLLLVLQTGFHNLYSQSYSVDYKSFTYKGANKFEIFSKDNNTTNQTLLRVSKDGIIIKEVKLDFVNEEPDMIYFDKYIDELKKYVIIKGRYSFILLNLYNFQLSKTYSATFYGIGQDAQSRMISGLKIIFNGRFVIGYCVDSGVFLYDFSDFYNGFEVFSANNPLVSANKIFVLNDFSNIGKKFGLFVYADGWEVDYKYLFKNKNIEYETFNYIGKNQDNIENIIENSTFADANYTILKEILPNNEFNFLVYDNYYGKLLNLPNIYKHADKQQIINYLNNKKT
ncbi:MAG: hypothetical protein JXR68_02715 [Bacteroidales bacterium]|nr:hypothetical protein [Bacteroidales bacterium]